MIPFFRKIRKKMADDNRPLKYIRYAIGEILLVVIGILIALQINNWNEERKQRVFEKKTLQLMKDNLKHDVNMFRGYAMTVLKNSIESSQIISEHLSEKKPYHDTLDVHFARIPGFTLTMTNTSTYDNLKANGFNLISNDSLRERYQMLYQFRYKLIDYQAKEVAARRATEFEKIYLKKFYNYQWLKHVKPRDYESLCMDLDFIELVKLVKGQNDDRLIGFNSTIEEIEVLISLIDEELKNI